jgi:hypothetical protein
MAGAASAAAGTMFTVTSNEKHNMSYADITRDARKVYADPAITTEPIVFYQELNAPAKHDAAIAAMPAGYTYIGRDSGTPLGIALPGRFEVVGTPKYVQTKAATTAPEGDGEGDAPRWFVSVRIHNTKFNGTNPDFQIINTHYTNGCKWDDLDNPPAGSNAAFLRPFWRDHFDLLNKEINDNRKLVENGGLNRTVFWGGDHNRQGTMPQYNSDEIQAIGQNAIDKLYAVSRSLATSLVTSGTVVTPTTYNSDGTIKENNSDHDARWAKWSVG